MKRTWLALVCQKCERSQTLTVSSVKISFCYKLLIDKGEKSEFISDSLNFDRSVV